MHIDNNYNTTSSLAQENSPENENVEQKTFIKQRERRRAQMCVFCRNHDINVPKKGHKGSCEFNNKAHINKCNRCIQTKDRQMFTAIEKKNNYHIQKSQPMMISISDPLFQIRTRAEQKCKKCLNHDIHTNMKNHLKDCEFAYCRCFKCRETDERRRSVKVEAKARREKIKVVKFEPLDSPRSVDSGFENGSPTYNYNTVECENEFYQLLNNQNHFFERSTSPNEHDFYSDRKIKTEYIEDYQPFDVIYPTTIELFESKEDICIESFADNVDEITLNNLVKKFSLMDYDEESLKILEEVGSMEF